MKNPPVGPRTVLLVEDEKSMLGFLEKIFLKQGYQVLTATDGAKALEIYRRYKQSIDAVLLDINLPKMAGQEVLLNMQQENPEVKIVIASGYLEPALRSEIERAGIKHFLHKPYAPDDAVKTLQSLIEMTP